MSLVEELADIESGIKILVNVHYNHFMQNKRFWYEKELQEADSIVCKLLSSMRRIAVNWGSLKA
jgi:hypothetical protein